MREDVGEELDASEDVAGLGVQDLMALDEGTRKVLPIADQVGGEAIVTLKDGNMINNQSINHNHQSKVS